MRILLHDTQANLEKFSNRVDKLADGIHESKQEIMMVHKMFQEEHDKLSGENIDLGEFLTYCTQSEQNFLPRFGLKAHGEYMRISGLHRSDIVQYEKYSE